MSQKILVIDDSIAASRVVENILQQDYPTANVLLAERAAEGFERFHLAQPSLILLNETLPDMDMEAVCSRLLHDRRTAQIPIALMTSNGRANDIAKRFKNVKSVLPKPVTQEALLPVLGEALNGGKRAPHPSNTVPFRDPSEIVFAGHTGYFSLRSALQMAHGDKLTGVLRVFINEYPVELFIQKGEFVFATTRNCQLYCRNSSVILSSTNLALIGEAQANQTATGCPLFLFLAMRNGFAHDDMVQITREHGQRLFSNLWTAGRVSFEFAEAASFPDYVRNFPPTDEGPENWMLASLRHTKFESLLPAQRPDPNDNPAYTRKGYELIQTLKLNDVEARFATAINGTESLQSIAKKINVPLNDALLIVYRFQVLEIVDFWSSTLLSLPKSTTNPAGP